VNRRLPGAIALAVACLAGCTGSLFQSKAAPPTIYLLSAPGAGTPAEVATAPGAPAAGGPAPEIPVDLAVLKPKLRPGLESDRIAVLYADRHLDYFADARWSGPLGEVLQDLAVQEFHSHANLRTVSGDGSVFASAYWLELEVTDFQAEYSSAAPAPVVHVHFLARIGSSAERRVLGQFEASAQQPAAENRLTAIVDAYAHAANAALAELVAHVDETLVKSQKLDKPVASAIR
jgi:cholesterol transport system auxiliary component